MVEILIKIPFCSLHLMKKITELTVESFVLMKLKLKDRENDFGN